MAYLIETIEEYDYLIKRGRTPLFDKHFELDINLRIEMQKRTFGLATFHRDIPRANEAFYRWVWDVKPHYCEECLKPLHEYSATFISHILTKGAFPEIAHDPRNTNILCFKHHEQWENGKREYMRIYPGNKITIQKLKQEYETDRISRT